MAFANFSPTLLISVAYKKACLCKTVVKPETLRKEIRRDLTLQKQLTEVSKISAFKNFTEFTKKKTIPEFLCNKVTGPQSESLLKKRLRHRCISLIFAKILKTPCL